MTGGRQRRITLTLPEDLADWLVGAFPPALGGGTLGGRVANIVPAMLEALRRDLEGDGASRLAELEESYRRLSPAGRVAAAAEAAAALAAGGRCME